MSLVVIIAMAMTGRLFSSEGTVYFQPLDVHNASNAPGIKAQTFFPRHADRGAPAAAHDDNSAEMAIAADANGEYGRMPPDALSPLNPGRWLKQPVFFTAQKHPLDALLRKFAAMQGVACQVSPKLAGMISGDFFFEDPADFLEALCRTQHMNWYFDGGVVHFFSNAELETKIFPLQDRQEGALKEALVALGLFDPRFEWRSADAGRLLLAQGPPVYLARISEVASQQSVIEELAQAGVIRERKLAVFRLKHAWAAEKTITAGNTNTVAPGVADLLKQILSESPLVDQPAALPEPRVGAPRLIKGFGVIGRETAEKRAAAPEAIGVPFIKADSRLNAVLVWDYEENLPRYREVIDILDQPLELVEIRAAIIDVETDRTRDLGFTWEYRGDNPNWQNNAGSNVGENTNRPYIPVVGDGFQYATIYKHGLDSFMARVSAMEREGDANILSRPTILTQDNTQAMLEHTDTFYVRLQGRDEVDLADIKTGLTLTVTPHVIQTEDGVIEGVQLAVYIVNGSNTADTDTGQVDNLPRVKQSTISTQAVVGEGEALVIGGYYNELRSVNRTGIPGLSKIPGLGTLFRRNNNVASKSERLFVLSPRIIRAGEIPIVPGSEGERALEHSPAKEEFIAPAKPENKGKAKKSKFTRRPGKSGK